jgi:6-pyruvoyl-tetrahydropterin synthase
MLTVEKEYKWEMAHRLIGWDQDKKVCVKYCDNCRNLHGHSYAAYIKMEATAQQDVYGMVYDYNKMKQMKQWIDTNLDHCVMISLHDDDLNNFINTQEGRDKKFVISGPSTAENICQLLFHMASRMLNDEHARVCEVRVKETDTSEATYKA